MCTLILGVLLVILFTASGCAVLAYLFPENHSPD